MSAALADPPLARPAPPRTLAHSGANWGTRAMARAAASGMAIATHEWHRANERSRSGLLLLRIRAHGARLQRLADERDDLFRELGTLYRALAACFHDGESRPGEEEELEARWPIARARYDALSEEIIATLIAGY